MEQNFNDIDHLFKEELGGYTETPPPAVWDALEKRLKGEDKRRIFPYRWWWYVSIVSFIVLLGSSVAWKMSRDAAHKTNMASLAAAIPQQTATANSPETAKKQDANGDVTNNKSKAGKKDHTAYTTTENNVTKEINQEDRTAVNHRRHKRHQQKHIGSPVKTFTHEDLYADTDDDQYTVGGHRNNVKYEHSEPRPEYITEPRTQHNIRVAETDPTQKAGESNYGSYTAVSASKLKTTTGSHLDIDLSDDAEPKTKNSSSARSAARTKPGKEILYASTSRHLVTHAKPPHKAAPSSPEMSASMPVTNASVKKHSLAGRKKSLKTEIRQTKPEVSVAKKTSSHKPTTNATATTKIAAVTEPAAAPIVKEEKLPNVAKTESKVASKETPAASTNVKKASSDEAKVVTVQKNERTATTAAPTKTQALKTATKSATADITSAASTSTTGSTAMQGTHSPTSKTKNSTEQTTTNSVPVKTTEKIALVALASAPANKDKHITAKAKRVHAPKTHSVVSTPTLPGNSPTPTNASPSSVATSKSKSESKKGKELKDDKIRPVVNSNIAATTTKHSAIKTQFGSSKSATAPKPDKTNNVVAQDEHEVAASATTGSLKEHGDHKKKNRRTKDPGTAPAQPAKILAVSKSGNSRTEIAENQAVSKVPANEHSKDTNSIKNSKADETSTAAKTLTGKESSKSKSSNSRSSKNSGNKHNEPAPRQLYAYSNSLQKFALEDETVLVDNLKVNTFTDTAPITSSNSDEQLMGTFKNDANTGDSKVSAPGAANDDSTTKHRRFAGKFEAGVKGGVETAFNGYGANKLVISPYLQYNLSDKFSLLTQPSFKASHVSRHGAGQDATYNDRSHGVYTQTDSGALYTVVYAGSNAVTIRNTLRKYNFSYDSIVKSYATDYTYMEVELPLLLKYKIGKGFSVYGGANSVWSKYANLKEHTNTYTSTYHTLTVLPASSPATLPVTANLNLPGTPISKYNGPLYPEQKGSLLRFGYMLGISYEFKKKWMVDMLVQQAMVKPHNEAGINTNQPLSLPYIRFTLGYKLSK